jgi:LCP family protein required for cell wall assembly
VASKDKPYRVYRAGRVRGPRRRAPLPIREQLREIEPEATDGDAGYPPTAPTPRRRRRRRWPWVVVGTILLAVVLFGVWGTLGWLAFRSGVEEANARLDARATNALAPQDGSLLSNPTTILLLGADSGAARGDEPGRSDAMMVIRTDPDEHRIAYLSIPRDLRVEIPGRGTDKINAAYAYGGAALAVRTVEQVTGLRPNHVAVVDFDKFREVVDALGGISVDVPRRIVSNRFDCPYKTPAECDRWPGWRFARGEQHLDGRRALVYSRIRENRLDPTETDITRGGRQQQIVQAVADEVVSPLGFVRMPFIGDDLVKPLATDLSAWELMQLGWVKYRAASSRTLQCRLGGDISADGAYIVGTEENREVLGMVTGQLAPQPPPPGTGLYGPGCVVGAD